MKRKQKSKTRKKYPSGKKKTPKISFDLGKMKATPESQKYSSMLIEDINDCIELVDRKMRIILVNKAYRRWLYSLGLRIDPVGKTITQAFPFLPKKVIDEYRQVFKSGKVLVSEENTILGKEVLSTETRKIPVIENGKIVRVITIIRDITDKKKAERMIQENNKFLRTVLGSLTHPFYVIDTKDYSIKMINAVGYDGKTLSGRQTCHELTHHSKKPCTGKHVCPLKEVKKTKKHVVVEHIHYDKDGKKRIVEIHGYPILDENGKVAQMIEYVLDITERKEGENSLRESQARLAKFMDSATDGFSLFDADLRLVDINRRALKMLGEDRENLIGKNIIDITPELRKTNRYAKYKKVTRTGKSVYIPAVIALPQFGDRIVSIKAFKVGEGLGIIETDITEDKKIAEKLRASEQRYRAIFEQSVEAVVLADIEAGGLADFNRSAHKNLGYTRKEFSKLRISDIEVIESQKEVEKHLKDILKKGSGIFETKHKTKSGKIRNVLVTSKPVSIEGKGFVVSIWRDITERKSAAEALKKEKEKAERYLDIAGVIMIAMNGRGNITLVNKKGCEILGYKEKEILGKNWFDNFLPFSISAQVKGVFKKLMKGDMAPVEYFENPVMTKDGNLRLIAWHNTMIKNDDGKIVGTLSSGEDITERKKAEDAIRESEVKYRRMIENARALVMMTRPDGVVSYLSPSCRHILGYDSDELIGTVANIFHPDDAVLVQNALAGAMQGKSGSSFEYRVITKEGETRWVNHSWTPVFMEKKLQTIISIITDVTERKKGEEALLQSEKNFRSLADNANDGILIVAGEGALVYANRRVREILGYNLSEIFKKTLGDVIVPDQREKVLKNYQSRIRGEYIQKQYEIKVLSKNGKEVDVEITGAKTLWRSEPADIVVIRDITERKNIAKMKDSLIRDMSHGLKSPVAMTEMAFHLLQEGIKKDDLAQMAKAEAIATSNLMKIKKDVNNMLEIFTLDMRKLAKQQRRKVSVKAVLGEVFDNMKPSFDKKGIKFILRERQDVGKVNIERRDLKTLLFNLLDNSMKFTSKGSVRISTALKGDYVEVEVSDTGCGIEAKHRDRVFDRFYKRHASIDGSGLGLSICREIVTMYGGRIAIHSKGLGKGTRVKMLLPMA
ncbi:MAG: PAS domain S-box protein [bacterium]